MATLAQRLPWASCGTMVNAMASFTTASSVLTRSTLVDACAGPGSVLIRSVALPVLCSSSPSTAYRSSQSTCVWL